MKLKLFSIYDSKAKNYDRVITLRTTEEAIRSFSYSINDEKHQYSTYPEDFVLFELGTYDEDTGMIEPYSSPISIGVGVNFVKKASVSEQV